MPNDNIVVKNYEHINRSFGNWDTPQGKYIKSKAQYQDEMARGGFKPYDGSGTPNRKEYKGSEDLKKTLYEVQKMADKKGNIHIANNGRLVEKMKKMGITFNPKFMTNELKGGIE